MEEEIKELSPLEKQIQKCGKQITELNEITDKNVSIVKEDLISMYQDMMDLLHDVSRMQEDIDKFIALVKGIYFEIQKKSPEDAIAITKHSIDVLLPFVKESMAEMETLVKEENDTPKDVH